MEEWNKVVRFEEDELEIAIVTYNRPSFVRKWLELCYADAAARNIRVSVYDSSTDDGTEGEVRRYNAEHGGAVSWTRVPSDTNIGYKPMLPLLASGCRYVWVSGDSRYQDFAELDEKVFPFVKQGIDYIALSVGYNLENGGRIYAERGRMLHDLFVTATCIGMSIYKTGLYDVLKRNPEMAKRCGDLFDDNYGFAWLGYFYTVFAEGSHTAVFCDTKCRDIDPGSKKQSWAKRFYGCWCDDLCQIADNLPDSYADKESVPRETWERMGLASCAYLYKARKWGDLDEETYVRLSAEGTLDRLTDKKGRIRFFAKAPMPVVEVVFLLYRWLGLVRRAAFRLKKERGTGS